MNPKLKKFLLSLGLRADATDQEAQEFYTGLNAQDKGRADAAANAPDPAPVPPAPVPAPDLNRQASTEDVIRHQAVQSERDRVRQINELAGTDVPAEMVRQAINDGWDVNRASREFLTAVRASRTPQGTPLQGAPAIHVRSHEVDCNVRSLAAGFAISQGLDPLRVRIHDGIHLPQRNAVLTEQDADLGDRYRNLSALDLLRECVRLDTGRYALDPTEALRSAISGTSFSHVFSTNVYAQLIAGWDRVGDTTMGWCDEEDVPNFMQQEDISVTANARLEQLARGDTATHATASDTHETYKIARYAKQFSMDEQDIIDDRLGARLRTVAEMGEAARRLRPDLVYSLINENPTLIADNGAVFNATATTTAGGHANLITGVLSDTNLKLAITAMGKQRVNNDVLNIAPRYLLVPSALDWTAQALTTTASLAKLFADSNDPIYTTENLIARKRLIPIMDDRLGASGVVDPRTKAVRAGSDTQWLLTAGGPRGLRVAYRRGTSRQPMMRSFTLDRGQWGMGWDINLDIGAAFMDYRYWHKSSGTV